MVATASTEHSYWLALAFEWKPGLTADCCASVTQLAQALDQQRARAFNDDVALVLLIIHAYQPLYAVDGSDNNNYGRPSYDRWLAKIADVCNYGRQISSW